MQKVSKSVLAKFKSQQLVETGNRDWSRLTRDWSIMFETIFGL